MSNVTAIFIRILCPKRRTRNGKSVSCFIDCTISKHCSFLTDCDDECSVIPHASFVFRGFRTGSQLLPLISKLWMWLLCTISTLTIGALPTSSSSVFLLNLSTRENHSCSLMQLRDWLNVPLNNVSRFNIVKYIFVRIQYVKTSRLVRWKPHDAAEVYTQCPALQHRQVYLREGVEFGFSWGGTQASTSPLCRISLCYVTY
jgi:hypothetical protein